MARVLVTDDSGERVLWDEEVRRVHFEDEHSGRQVVERLAWAVADAESGCAMPVPYRQRGAREAAA